MSDKVDDRLLCAAAVFLDSDRGTAGFADRFAASVPGIPVEMARALDQAFAAKERAGRARFAIGIGDVRIALTSSGAEVSAGLVAGPDGSAAVAVRILDLDHATVAGAALRVTDLNGVSTVVTDDAGRADVHATGASVFIQIGDFRRQGGSADPAGSGVVALRRPLARLTYDLAAADESDALSPAVDLGRWHTEAGGVAFSYQARTGGGDLTLLVREEPAGILAFPADTHGVQFDTWGSSGNKRRWIVPVAPGPLGFAGSLYGTDEHWLDRHSVEVRALCEFVSELGDTLDEVVRRSVRHADNEAAWLALSRSLDPGRRRSAVEAALEHRMSS